MPDSSKNRGTTLITAHIEDFTRHDVGTKATDNSESTINNLAMLVFGKSEDKMVLIAEPIVVDEAKLNFVINTTASDDGQYIANIQDDAKNSFKGFGGDLTKCRMYIVANINDLLPADKISENTYSEYTEEAFLNISYNILANVPEGGADNKSVFIPESGFPMIGWMDVDLSPNTSLGSGNQQALTVSLKKLFSKINCKFLVQLDSENIPGGMVMVKTPYFEPTNWSVHNIPMAFTLKDDPAEEKPAASVFYTQDFSTFTFSTPLSQTNKRIENSTSGDEYFTFSFYLPEYKVLPAKDRSSLAQNIESHLRQCYKPTFCGSGQMPTYIEITGKYSDHQGHISEVAYNLYLGQNEIDDFQIIRNQELNNTVIIKGLTNHSKGEGISIDHRVEITSSGYSIAMERETLLDSHYEFRPMDISIQEGAVVVVKIPSEHTWFAAERADVINQSGINLNLYDNTKPGLRKYFTPSLLSEIGSTREFIFTASDNNDGKKDEVSFRLWFYFDENVHNPYDDSEPASDANKLYREAKIYVDFYDNESAYADGGTPTQPNREFTFRQMNLWTINGHLSNKQYSIEYFEEYLYNYASDDNYGITTDGMAWGLNNTPLSTLYRAVYADRSDMGGLLEYILRWFGGSFTNMFNSAFNSMDAKYDFYLERDEVESSRDYSGLSFTREIVNEANIIDRKIALSQKVESAVEYCYNKNKRNSDGIVETIHWYLPAIDETEEILVDGFNYFPVFQSKFYWSSQPAYDKYNYTATYISSWIGTAKGYYYSDDIDRARATRVTATSTSEQSGVDGAIASTSISIEGSNSATAGTPQPSGETITYHAGNHLRTQENRVRCVYSPEGVSAYFFTATKLYGTYTVETSTNAAGTSGVASFNVTISESNDTSKGNVMLSNYLHNSYKSEDYPQYANFDASSGILTIAMDQRIGGNNRNPVNSVLYSGNTAITNGVLTLKYNQTDKTFTIVDNANYNLRYTGSNSPTASYIQSFKKE